MTCNTPKTIYKERDLALMISYNKVLARHGKYASYIKKEELYEEAGRVVFLSSKHAGRLIRKMLSDKTFSINPVTNNEILEEIKNVEEIIRQLDRGSIGKKRSSVI